MKNFTNKKSSGDWKSGGKGGFNKGGYKGAGGYKGKPSFGGARAGGFSRGGDREERPELHSATCNQCGKSCEVPFKPNGKKPIYCRDCFRKEEGHASAPRYGGSNSDRPSFDRPSYDRPSYDRQDASEKPAYRSTPRVGSDEVAKQLKELNAKMDRILNALTDLGEEAEGEDEENEDET